MRRLTAIGLVSGLSIAAMAFGARAEGVHTVTCGDGHIYEFDAGRLDRPFTKADAALLCGVRDTDTGQPITDPDRLLKVLKDNDEIEAVSPINSKFQAKPASPGEATTAGSGAPPTDLRTNGLATPPLVGPRSSSGDPAVLDTTRADPDAACDRLIEEDLLKQAQTGLVPPKRSCHTLKRRAHDLIRNPLAWFLVVLGAGGLAVSAYRRGQRS